MIADFSESPSSDAGQACSTRLAHLARPVDTDAVWRAIARRSVLDVVRESPIHSLTVGSLRRAVQRAPVRHYTYATN